MRGSNHPRPLIAVAASAIFVLTACATEVPSSPPPTLRPTPVITPDPHLTEPATADEVFTAIRSAGLPLNVNNATSGGPASPLVKRINAEIGNWPLIITEFRSSVILRGNASWDPSKPPAQGNPPFAFVGLNILVEFGPVTGSPEEPNATRQDQARRLVALLDPLLWPLEQRSVVAIPVRSAPPSSATAGKGSASPAP